jgi:hypothetical protein
MTVGRVKQNSHMRLIDARNEWAESRHDRRHFPQTCLFWRPPGSVKSEGAQEDAAALTLRFCAWAPVRYRAFLPMSRRTCIPSNDTASTPA